MLDDDRRAASRAPRFDFDERLREGAGVCMPVVGCGATPAAPILRHRS